MAGDKGGFDSLVDSDPTGLPVSPWEVPLDLIELSDLAVLAMVTLPGFAKDDTGPRLTLPESDGGSCQIAFCLIQQWPRMSGMLALSSGSVFTMRRNRSFTSGDKLSSILYSPLRILAFTTASLGLFLLLRHTYS